jgi:hypothetical protein
MSVMSRYVIFCLSAIILLTLAACEAGQSTLQADYPDQQSRAFQIFARQCSQCHAPPMPTAHTAMEWPSVMARMQQHRIQRSLAPIMAQDMVVIRDYLIRHAKKDETS